MYGMRFINANTQHATRNTRNDDNDDESLTTLLRNSYLYEYMRATATSYMYCE